MNYYWRIVALIGTLVFLISVFLPVYTFLGDSTSLVNVYQNAGMIDWGASFSSYPVATIGLLLMMILWPIALVLCIVAIFKHRIGIAAGVVGIVCWVGAVMYVGGFSGTLALQYGAAIYVGFAGAIIMIVARYINLNPAAPQAGMEQAVPPPPPLQTASAVCPTCGYPLSYVQQYGRWYCYNCNKYP